MRAYRKEKKQNKLKFVVTENKKNDPKRMSCTSNLRKSWSIGEITFWCQYHHIRKNIYNEFHKCLFINFYYNIEFERTPCSIVYKILLYLDKEFFNDNGKVEDLNLFR